jgi:soluble lytic murein transglycosylase-like protein
MGQGHIELFSEKEHKDTWRRAAWKFFAILATCLTFVALPWAGWVAATIHSAHEQDRVESDPTRLSQFIQARSQKVPAEVAVLMAGLIHKVAQENDVPAELVVAIIEKESLFNPFAVSSAGAQGLMQILVGNEPIDRSKAHSIEYNLQVGTKILREKLVVAKGDLNRALELYSGGAGGYSGDVLTCLGRYILFKESKEEKK